MPTPAPRSPAGRARPRGRNCAARRCDVRPDPPAVTRQGILEAIDDVLVDALEYRPESHATRGARRSSRCRQRRPARGFLHHGERGRGRAGEPKLETHAEALGECPGQLVLRALGTGGALVVRERAVARHDPEQRPARRICSRAPGIREQVPIIRATSEDRGYAKPAAESPPGRGGGSGFRLH